VLSTPSPHVPDPLPFGLDEGPAFTWQVLPDRDVVTVAVHGELDLGTAPSLDAQLRELRDAGFRHLIVDLGGLTFIESTGVHLLLAWTESARRDGHTFGVVAGRERIQSVFAMTGTIDLLEFVPRR
jgi:anti-sigma B factor antagonist